MCWWGRGTFRGLVHRSRVLAPHVLCVFLRSPVASRRQTARSFVTVLQPLRAALGSLSVDSLPSNLRHAYPEFTFAPLYLKLLSLELPLRVPHPYLTTQSLCLLHFLVTEPHFAIADHNTEHRECTIFRKSTACLPALFLFVGIILTL